MENYFIKEGYKCNLDSEGRAIPFLDDEFGASTYQIKVYAYAKRLVCQYEAKSVLDIGCGLGIKLKDIILPVCRNIVGIDAKHAIDFCRKEYRFGRWFEDDIENPKLKLDEKFDCIIASDVIEHLVNPDNLLNCIRKYSHQNTHIIISTPARDLLKNKKAFGPPLNKTHVREWSRAEFRNYIVNRGFSVIRHFLVGEVGLNAYEFIRKICIREPLRKIQVAHCMLERREIR